MQLFRRSEQIAIYVVFGLMGVMLLFQVFAQRGLFADGAYQLLNLLVIENDRTVHGLHTSLFHELVTSNNYPLRFFSLFLTQFPTVIALRLGATNLDFLFYLFSFSLLFIPIFFWVMALWKVRSDSLFWPLLLIFTVTFFNGNFFGIGEYNIGYAIAACCCVFILKSGNNSRIEQFFLFITAFLSILSYGATMFTGILLCALALYRFSYARSNSAKTYWATLAFFFICSIGAGLHDYLYPTIPGGLQNAQNLGGLFHNSQFCFTTLYALLATMGCFYKKKEYQAVQCYLLLAACALFILIGLNAYPFQSFMVRAFAGLFLLGALCVVSLYELFGKKWKSNSVQLYAALPIFVLFTMLVGFDIQSSLEFHDYLNDVRKTVNNHTGLLHYETSIAFLPNDRLYGWTWTYPTMGLLLRKNEHAALVIQPIYQQGHWQPFDPEGFVPDLSRYYSQN